MVHGRGTTRWHFLAAAALIATAGCATTTAPSGSPQIAAELQPSRVEADTVTKAERAKQYFIRGMTEAYVGNHESALDLYARALRLVPHSAALLSAAAESHEALGDERSALYHARRARELEPENPHFHFELARVFLNRGDTKDAIRTYEEMRELFPHELDVHYELARVYTIDAQYTRAIEAYQNLLDEIGGDRDIQQEMLHLYGRLGDEAGMENVLLKMVDQHPLDAGLRRRLGEAYARQGREADAAAQFEEALQLNPDDVETLLALTDLYRELGRSDSADALLERAVNVEASTAEELLSQASPLLSRAGRDPEAIRTVEKLLERALEMDPTNADALVMMGDLRLEQGDAEAAGVLLYRALEQNPRDPQIWIQAAGAFLQSGDRDRAVSVADEGLQLFPGFVPLLRLSGHALLESYQNRRAVDRFEEAVRIIREDRSEAETELGDLLGALGLLHTRLEDFDAADRAYEDAIASDPNNAGVLNNYAYSLAERGIKLDRAEEMAIRATELEPDVAAYLDTLGWVYFKRGDLQSARRWLLKAAEHRDATATVFEHLGDAHNALDESEAAREAWSQALELNPDNTSLVRKLGRSQ